MWCRIVSAEINESNIAKKKEASFGFDHYEEPTAECSNVECNVLTLITDRNTSLCISNHCQKVSFSHILSVLLCKSVRDFVLLSQALCSVSYLTLL